MKITIYSNYEGYDPKDSEWALGTFGDIICFGPTTKEIWSFQFVPFDYFDCWKAGRQLFKIDWKDLC